ncbi:MAG: fumarylacetoacetate hydrolase family protein [Planctomycetota bacterium]
MNLIRTTEGVFVERPGSPPLRLGYVIGIGRNYAEHAKEQGADLPDRPMVFTKSSQSLTLHGEPIIIPGVCRDPESGGPDQVDYEAELAVVLGEPIKNATQEEASAAVLGYACANDVSARWWQKKGSGGQFCRGKSFDTFCPIGPRVVPAADIAEPQALAVRCRVSGELMQDGSTSQMIFPIAELLADLSRGATLPAGTVVLTGTPSGVGAARTPPRFLATGDTVDIEIEGIGTLSNPVENAPA